METKAPFLAVGNEFMARGRRHIIKHVFRRGEEREVLVIGATEYGLYFEATFGWDDTVDTLSRGA